MAKNEKEKNQINKFQVESMLNPVLNTNKAFREQVEINLNLTFDSKKMMPIRKMLRKQNTSVILLLMFYENIKNMISGCYI